MRAKIAGMFAGLAALCLSGAADAQLSVSSAATSGVACTSGVCTTTKAKAILNITQLQNLLKSFDVQLKPGSLSKDIVIAAAVFWASSHRLTLDSYRSITINKPVQVTGSGALTMTTDDGGTGGALTYYPSASVTFLSLSSSLIINGKTFTLENSIASLAAAIAANASGNFALANSYDAKADGTYTASPIPTFYEGTFDGLNNTISDFRLIVSSGKLAGLFAQLGFDGVIRHVKLLKVYVKATGRDMNETGGLVAEDDGDAVSYVTASGIVSGNGPAGTGGVVGYLTEGVSVDHVQSSVNVLGVLAGGVVGDNGGVVSDSSASGQVKTVASVVTHDIGGLVGNNIGGTVQRCFATGAVNAGIAISNAGGLVGENQGEIADSYATGAVTANHQAAGGLVGINEQFIDRSYSTGTVKGLASSVGGFIGLDLTKGLNGTLTFDYWDTTTSGITSLSQGAGDPANDPGITGLSDSALKSGLPSGFDNKVWAEKSTINGGLPYLISNRP